MSKLARISIGVVVTLALLAGLCIGRISPGFARRESIGSLGLARSDSRGSARAPARDQGTKPKRRVRMGIAAITICTPPK